MALATPQRLYKDKSMIASCKGLGTNPGDPLKVVLVDDHRLMRDGLRAILEREPRVRVVGEASDGHEALAVTGRAEPDIVVMDVSMRGLNGVDATRRLTSERPEVKVLGLSMNADARYVLSMLTAGAAGYLLKDAAAEELLSALQAVAQGRRYLSSSIAGVVIDAATKPPPVVDAASSSRLSVREREVLQLLAEGATSKDIAAKLHIATTTVESHRRQIMQKLDLRTIAELTKYAVREGLTTLLS